MSDTQKITKPTVADARFALEQAWAYYTPAAPVKPAKTPAEYYEYIAVGA